MSSRNGRNLPSACLRSVTFCSYISFVDADLGVAGGEVVVPEEGELLAERVAAFEHRVEPPRRGGWPARCRTGRSRSGVRAGRPRPVRRSMRWSSVFGVRRARPCRSRRPVRRTRRGGRGGRPTCGSTRHRPVATASTPRPDRPCSDRTGELGHDRTPLGCRPGRQMRRRVTALSLMGRVNQVAGSAQSTGRELGERSRIHQPNNPVPANRAPTVSSPSPRLP